jgi:hypothetical protein
MAIPEFPHPSPLVKNGDFACFRGATLHVLISDAGVALSQNGFSKFCPIEML